jgi:hypothetical protein
MSTRFTSKKYLIIYSNREINCTFTYLSVTRNLAEPGGRSVKVVDTQPITFWDGGSILAVVMPVCLVCELCVVR